MKYLKIIFFCCIMFLFHGVVNAKTIGIDEVTNEIPNTYTIKGLNSIGSSLSARIDDENNKLNFFSEDELFASLNYTKEYIEYDIGNAIITDENYWGYFTTTLAIEGVMESLLNLSGHQDISIIEKIAEVENLNYEEYGVQLEIDTYVTSDDSGSADYIKYFKITLDSEVISNLAEQYGENLNTEEESIFKDATPTMRIGDKITSNSVYLYANIEGYEEEKEIDTPLCSFYRSTSLEGEYELVTEWQTPCLGEVGILDENLKSGTTYYYKAKVVDGNNYSEVVSVTTLNDNNETENEEGKNENEGKENIEINPDVSNSDKNNEEISNPKTGGNLIFLVIGCLLLSIFSFIMMYKNLKFI